LDPRLLRHYNTELQHLREMGAEFAREFPKVASRLGIEGLAVADPYVERLLEGAAFLAARVQMRLDAEFPRFTQQLLEVVHPNCVAPTPAMAVVQLRPDLAESNLARGCRVPRGTAMRSAALHGEGTACELRTAHDVTLWPVEVVAADYFAVAPDLPLQKLPGGVRPRGGVRLRLRSTAGLRFCDLALDRLVFFLGGADDVALKLHELALGRCLGALVCPVERPARWAELLPPASVRARGYEDDYALLPVTPRAFQGYRLLQEYFAFPERFLFVEVASLAAALRRADTAEIELALLFDRGEASLEGRVAAGHFMLNCTPAINLFPKRADRIHLNAADHEHHVVPDRTRPLDFEVFAVTEVSGHGTRAGSEQIFRPLYAASHAEGEQSERAYFTVRRELRMPSAAERRRGARSSYPGTETFLAIVDANEAPYRADLRQLGVATLCTNRDLLLQMPLDAGTTDFVLESAAPVVAIRVVKGPTRPGTPLAEGAAAWDLVRHLSLNYTSLLEEHCEAAALIRRLLGLHARAGDEPAAKQIEGVKDVRTRPLVRRLPLPGPIAFGRGVGIEIELDDLAFEGASPFLFGSVMERVLARHASLNSFTETTLRTARRGEVMCWRPRCGARPIL
jgi:type VI secretion system protein ImpG